MADRFDGDVEVSKGKLCAGLWVLVTGSRTEKRDVPGKVRRSEGMHRQLAAGIFLGRDSWN